MPDLRPLNRPLMPGVAADLPYSSLSLLDLADRLLNRGVVVAGEATISVAGIDLVYLGLNLILASVETLRASRSPGVGTARPEGPPVAHPEGQEDGGARHTPPASPSPGPQVAGSDLSFPAEVGPAAYSSSPAPPPSSPVNLDLDPDRMEEGLARLVLTLVELIRQLLERQAVRRMEGGSLTDAEVERLGLALLRLQEKLHEMAAAFGLRPEDLNINLGPLGNLL